jgi:hypothetical protein
MLGITNPERTVNDVGSPPRSLNMTHSTQYALLFAANNEVEDENEDEDREEDIGKNDRGGEGGTTGWIRKGQWGGFGERQSVSLQPGGG